MKLVFDARPMANQFTGLGRYTGSLLDALLTNKSCESVEIIVLLHTQYDWANNFYFRKLNNHVHADRCSLTYVDAPPISLKQHMTVCKVVNELSPDRYFYPHFDVPFGIKAHTTFVVHDLIPLLVPGYVETLAFFKRMYFKNMLKIGVHKASRCVAVSETTRKDILNVLGEEYSEKVEVAYEGPVLSQSNADINIESNIFVKEPFLLYVGDRRPHKNLPRVVELFTHLRDFHGYTGSLVLVGSTKNYGIDIDQIINDCSDINVLGNISDLELTSLYKRMDALVFLSKYEGFGLPVVEAARFGRKMILSDGGSLAEIAPPEACILSNDLATIDAAKTVAAYLRQYSSIDYTNYNDRFSWENTAQSIFSEAFL